MSSPEESTRIVQLKVRLLGISPMIWRRVLVPASVSLHELHGILQVGMGWEGIHLYYLKPLQIWFVQPFLFWDGDRTPTPTAPL